MILRDNSQSRTWIALADLADEVGDNLPCRQAPDLYFAGQGETYESNMAKRACQSCPIQEQCLSYALKYKENEGIWGGLTAGERKKIRYRK